MKQNRRSWNYIQYTMQEQIYLQNLDCGLLGWNNMQITCCSKDEGSIFL